MTTIYHYDATTGLLTERGSARESPLEPGVFLMPALATEIAPPSELPGMVAVFTADAWLLVPDNRGTWFGADRESRDVFDPRESVDGLVREAPPSADHDLVDGAWVLNATRYKARTIQALQGAVQMHLDVSAAARGYDDIKTAVTYADEDEDPQFQAEGRAYRRWRSQVWRACYSLMAEVEAGTRPIPTAEQLIALMPELELPA